MSIFVTGVTVMLVSSCGNKLYSYRKTVKVKSELAQEQEKPANTKIYMTISEEKTTPELNVNKNKLNEITKPITERENVNTIGTTPTIYRATIR